ncbi:hypothetical protein C2845_PM05G04800 [Panicum miliaceum]|uniref:Uncharacterized protein n=1 Tax=Panicum miliaceum TaxID=4540 RepID=A0A3L6SZ53_PANMI|nr:hypothetical protein C2845_PM05G04800 [Panicum miliaceum]
MRYSFPLSHPQYENLRTGLRYRSRESVRYRPTWRRPARPTWPSRPSAAMKPGERERGRETTPPPPCGRGGRRRGGGRDQRQQRGRRELRLRREQQRRAKRAPAAATGPAASGSRTRRGRRLVEVDVEMRRAIHAAVAPPLLALEWAAEGAGRESAPVRVKQRKKS